MKTIMAALAFALLAGCQQQYYRITDVQTGREFYTRSIEGGGVPHTVGHCGLHGPDDRRSRLSSFLPGNQNCAGGCTCDAEIEVMTDKKDWRIPCAERAFCG